MRTSHLMVSTVLASLALASTAVSAPFISELMFNPPSTDNGQEFIEIGSTTGGVEALTGLTLLEIEGDNTGAGVINSVINLGSFSTGANGILLIRDSATTLLPAPTGGPTVIINDFTPDLQNGTTTFMLVTGFTGSVGNDIDTNNDGSIDSTPWTTIVDAVGILESGDTLGSTGFLYTGNILTESFAVQAVFYHPTDGWIGGGIVVGTVSPGPYPIRADQVSNAAYASYVLTPGEQNFGPPPTSVEGSWSLYE